MIDAVNAVTVASLLIVAHMWIAIIATTLLLPDEVFQ